MLGFRYYNPVKVYFGKGVLRHLGKEVASFGKKVLFVYGMGSIKKTGLYDRVVEQLKEAGVEIVEHGGVKPNPVLSHTREGVEKAKREGVDVVLAVGGGSVIDEAKAIAAGAVADCDVWDFFEFKAQVKRALPIVTVLTISGTGSEMNAGLVITNEEKKAKFGFRADPLYPRVSFLDPTLTFTVPADQTAYGSVDAFTHVSEVYCNAADIRADVPRGIMETIMKSIVKWAPVAVREPENYEARAELMWCSSLALSGITWCGAGDLALPAHMIEHSLSAIYDVAHGAGLAIVVPAWMRYMRDRQKEHLELFAKNVFGKDSIDQGIDAFEDWMKGLGCPTRLGDIGVKESDIPEIAENAYQLSVVWGMSDFYTVEVIGDILRLAL